MSGFREKITPFTLGLSIGLLAACLFFIFKLDDYLRKIDFTSLNKQGNVSEEVTRPDKADSAAEEKKEKRPASNTNARKAQPGTSEENKSPFISVNNITDSSFNSSENYRVLKEELQSVKNVYVKVINPPKTNTKDSIIASLAGVSLPDDKEFFMIEFWKTPLNSKGYKMTRSRLLIYGFNEGQDIQLVKDADKYYLRNNNIIYLLSYSAEFRPLERAQDNETAGKFN